MDYEAARAATIAANIALLASLGIKREEKKVVPRQPQQIPEWQKALKPRTRLPREAKTKTQLVNRARTRDTRKRKRHSSGTDSEDESGSMSDSLNDDDDEDEESGPDSDGYDGEGFLVSARSRAERALYEREDSHEATAPYEVRQVIKHSASGKTSVVHTRVLHGQKAQRTRPRVIRSLSTESAGPPARHRKSQNTGPNKRQISEVYDISSDDDDDEEEIYARQHMEEDEVIPESKQRKWVANTKEERFPPTLEEKKAMQLKADRTKRAAQRVVRQQLEVIDLDPDSSEEGTPADGVYRSTKRRVPHRSRHRVNASDDDSDDDVEVVVVAGLR